MPITFTPEGVAKNDLSVTTSESPGLFGTPMKESTAGLLTGGALFALLSRQYAKERTKALLKKAIKKGIPVNMSIVNPIVAGAAGMGTGILLSQLYNKYKNSSDNYY